MIRISSSSVCPHDFPKLPSSYLLEVFLRLPTRLLTNQPLVSELSVVDGPVAQACHLGRFSL